ncbi:MAG: glycosyltransferase [Thermodesulfovibrionales bacterium]|nr:glycosyltransferase [Thermodesulfovibrionales bacterium]
MTVSVIIPTLNAEKHLATLLKSLWSQNQPPTEVIIIDSLSEDNTIAIAKDFSAKVIQIKRESFDHGGTRNLALRETEHDIVIFMTQDAIPANEYFIENLIKPLTKKDIPLSYGRQIPRTDANIIEKLIRRYNYPEESITKDLSKIKTLGIKTFFCSNVCCAVRKREFEEVGGFPERIIMNEDMVLAAKMILRGYKIAYEASAMVIHSHNYTLKELFQRYFDIGVSLSRNRWIVDSTKIEKEGKHLLINLTKNLMNEKKPHLIFPFLLQSFMKYSGYRIGFLEKRLPKRSKDILACTRVFGMKIDKSFLWSNIFSFERYKCIINSSFEFVKRLCRALEFKFIYKIEVLICPLSL